MTKSMLKYNHLRDTEKSHMTARQKVTHKPLTGLGHKPKTRSVSFWKGKCWDLFSQVIRLRDCLQTMHRPDWGKCCTCGVIKEFKELQAGHFIPGRHNSILFDMRGCHAQCYHCNVGLKGNPRKYQKFMLEKYGQDVIDELDRLDGESKQFKVWMLEEMYQQFTVIKNGLENEIHES